MARLPSDAEIGLPNAQSGRTIASYDVTGYARGAAAQAKGAQDLGEGIAKAGREVSIGIRHQQGENDKLELARARADFLTGKVNADTEFKDDPDYTTLPTRYGEKINEVARVSSERITSPRNRELFSLAVADDVARGTAAMGERANAKWKDHTLADATTKLDGLGQGYLLSADPVERTKMIDTGNALLDSLVDKNIITRTEAAIKKKAWVENQAVALVSTMSPEERVKLLRPQTTSDQVVDRIVGVESGGKANAKNPLSSAYGSGQFISSTWLNLIKETKPELARGRSDEQLLDLRSDPNLSREMVGAYAAKNGAFLKSQGIEATPGNTYLAHFLGPQGAAAVLKADPNTPVSEIVGRDAVRANPSILGGKTAGSVASWASDKMGGTQTAQGPAGFIPADQRMKLYRQAETEVAQRQNAAGIARGEELEASIIDAKAGKGDMPPRSVIESDPTISESVRNALKVRYDTAVGDVASAQAAWTKFSDPNAGSFNPYTKDDRDNADVIYQRLGGGPIALQAVVDRTGIMPASAATAIRGDLVSGNPQKVAGALTLSANLLTRNPNVFAKTEGKEDIENNAITFRTYVDNFGMSAQEATQKMIKEQTPEYQAQLKTKLKNEDIDKIVKTRLSLTDLTSGFNEGLPIIGRPNVEFDPRARKEAFDDYAEIFRDRYMETGDVNVAKSQAVAQMKKVWGVSSVSGTSTLMKYPPEKSPLLAGVEGASAHIAKQAIDAIRDGAGGDVFDAAKRQYPILQKSDIAYKSTPREGPNKLEFWPAGEPGSPESPRPKDFPLNKSGVEIYSKDVRPIDVLGDVVSHQLIKTDPKVSDTYKKFEASLTPEQNARLADQYEHAKTNGGETRSFEKWRETSGLPAYFRGYAFKQWPDEFNKVAYTPAQTKMLDGMMSYLTEGSNEVDRKSIRLSPIPGVTAAAFKNGDPAPYMLMWVDKNGLVQSLSPGKAFVPDVGAMKDAQGEQRRASLEGRQVIADPMLNRREQMQANKRGIQDATRERFAQTRREVGLETADADR